MNPGDRSADCGGMMEPTAIEGGQEYTVVHRCMKCALVRHNRVSPKDSVEALVKLAGNPISPDGLNA